MRIFQFYIKSIILNIMENAKKMSILPKDNNGQLTKVGLKTGNDFASKWGQGLKGKSGITHGMRLIIELWNMCFENIPEGKKILQSRIDEKYIDALVAKDKGNSQCNSQGH